MVIKGRILIVDDSLTSLKLLEKIYTDNEYEVFTTTSGELALSSVISIMPDIILLDIQMKGIDGFEVCRKLKENPWTHEIPIIFLSALFNTEDKVQGLKLGAVDFISKPFQSEEMFARVQNHLQLSQMRMQLDRQTKELIETNKRLEEEILQRKKAQTYEKKIITELEASGLKFRSIVESSPMGMHLYNLHPNGELILIGANPSADKMLGIDHQKQIGKTIQGAFPNLANTNVPEMYSKIAAGEMGIQQFEIAHLDEQQINRVYSVTVFQSGKNFVTAQFFDVSEQKNAEMALKVSEERFRHVFEFSHIGMSMTGVDGALRANRAFCEMVGYTEEELQGKSWKEITHPDDIEESKQAIQTLLTSENEVNYEKRYLHKNGSTVYTNVFSKLQRDENNNPSFFITSIINISERKTTEFLLQQKNDEILAQNEEFQQLNEELDHTNHELIRAKINAEEGEILYHTVVSNTPLVTFVLNAKGIFTLSEGKGLEKLGLKPGQVVGLSAFDVYKEYPAVVQDIKQALTGKNIRSESALPGVVFDVIYTPVFDNQGNVNEVIGVAHDITERKTDEESIKTEQKLLRTLIENLPDAVYIKDTNARKIITNAADLKFLDAESESEVLGKTDLELYSGAIGARGYNDDMEVLTTRKPVINKEEYFQLANGEQHWLLTSKIPFSNSKDEISGLVGIGRDITELKKSNEAIIKLSKAIEQSPLSIVITNTKGEIEYTNPKFTEVTGYSSIEAKGQNPRMLKSGETPTEEYTELWNAISNGKEWHGEFHNRKKNGELYWESASISPIVNEKGEIINFIAIKEDISIQKELLEELVVSKEKAEESDRLKSAFLANMSHEIRTPLNGILGFTELLIDPDFNEKQKADMARLVLDNGDQLLAIINDVLDISKIESGQIELKYSLFSVKQMINDIKKSFEQRAQVHKIDLRLAENIPVEEIDLKSDFTKIKQVLSNLLSNALKYTDKGFVEIGFKATEKELIFHVKDSGVGIPAEFREKIFDRFRHLEPNRSKLAGGNGLGLSISKSFIEMMGGQIWVESEVGKGSTFYFTLPVI